MNNVIRITDIKIEFTTDDVGGAIDRFGMTIAISSPQVLELARVLYSAPQLVARKAR